MGGNALKNCVTRRFNKSEYEAISAKVLTILDTVLAWRGFIRKAEVVKSFKNKESFGDLDVVVMSDELPPNWIELLKKAFNSKEVFKNGDVLSFEVDEFQVDLIMTKECDFKFATHYFAYNDLGNLMGKLTRQMGVKYGHNGMWYTFKDGTEVMGELRLTYDEKEVFYFLGLSYAKWLEGFDDLEDIFNYVATSKYFNPHVYALAELSNAGRMRDRKRETYNKFLEWCKKYDGPVYEFDRNKVVYLPMLCDYFDGYEGYDSMLKRHAGLRQAWFDARWARYDRREYRSKFNGNIVSVNTGLEGKELGEFMQFAKPHMTSIFVLSQDDDMIYKKVMSLYETFKEKTYV